MQKVLRKRVLRDLKENLFRYLALGLLIAMGIFLVVTIVGSAETLTRGTEKLAKEKKLEDGEFEVFVPLSDSDIKGITDMGVEVSKQFYLDYVKGEATVRIFKVRDRINKIECVKGKEPASDGEIVIEKRYAAENGLKVGDKFEIAGTEYKISGIGVVPDYDGPFKEISDTSCNSKYFGLVFMTDSAYEAFSQSGRAEKSEKYLYTYRLGNGKTDKDVKDYLKNLKIDASEVDDELFQEYWDRTGGIADDLKDAVGKLSDASDEIDEALSELKGRNNDILDATDNAIVQMTLKDAKEQLSELKAYKDGIADYTAAVAEIKDGTGELSDGVDELEGAVNDTLEEYDFGLSNLTMFLKRSDNPRVFATKNDKVVDIEVGIIAGIVLLILMAYVISVFVVHSIESESSIIGTLYSMGVTKNDLIVHYVTLPVVVTFLSGLAGALIAATGVMAPMIADTSYLYFSIPEFSFNIPLYLWIYSVVVPPVMAILVNVLVINKKLDRTALSLIRNEAKQGRISKLDLSRMDFVRSFRIRQMIRELRSGITVVLGMFMALLVFMISVDCYVLCSHIADDYARDTKFEYMYTLKYPEKEVPEGAEEAYAYTCKKFTMGYNFDVTILGIKDSNPYFDVNTGDSKVDVAVSSAFAEKFALKEGEEFVVTDDEKEMKYAFTVKEITRYSAGFYIFMNIDTMRDMFGENSDYYNVLFSDKALDIDPGRLYATTSRADVVKGAGIFTDLMMPMVYTLSGASVVIFCMVMYLMMKVMIDRSAHNISLIKVFGYRRKEIKKLYLDGNLYIVAAGALICLPLSKKLMNMMFPFMISNVTCGLNLKTPLWFFFVTYAVIIALYFLINGLLVRKLDRFTPAEVLKNRE